jgi:hypothetical protein
MKILNAGGIPEEERKSFVSVVYNTVLSQMKILVQAAHTEQCNLGDASVVVVFGRRYFSQLSFCYHFRSIHISIYLALPPVWVQS